MSAGAGSVARPAWGVVCALRRELGSLAGLARKRVERNGLEVLEIELGEQRAFACVGGVGTRAAAHAATTLMEHGELAGLLVVGVCGGLRQHLTPGTFVHCTAAVQVDRDGQERVDLATNDALREAWSSIAPGRAGRFLTADQPVLSLLRRRALARAYPGDCVAEMETAAVATVARNGGLRWAALRAVTDRCTELGHLSFRWHFRSQAGRAADTVPALLSALAPRSLAPRSLAPRSSV